MAARLAASVAESLPTDRSERPRLLVEGGGNLNGSLMAAGVVDEISLLIAPAIDGALGITGVFEVASAAGLAGKARLRFVSSETLAHGLEHLRYAVEAP